MKDEQELNPSPHKYRVSTAIKLVFLVFLIVGLSAYSYMIIERRYWQGQYLLQNSMAAVKLLAKPVPSLSMLDPNTQNLYQLTQFQGSWVLLNLWATWCPPCQAEMPSLEHLQKSYGSKLTIIALAVDEKADAVLDFIKTNNPGFKVLFDQQKMVPKLFGVDKYPETFLISPDGMLVSQFSGPRDWSSVSAHIYFDSILK